MKFSYGHFLKSIVLVGLCLSAIYADASTLTVKPSGAATTFSSSVDANGNTLSNVGGAGTDFGSAGQLTVGPTVGTTGSAALTVNQAANTAITSDVPAISVTAASPVLGSGQTIAIGSWLKLAAPTFVGVAGGPAETVTSAATLYIDNAPTQGANLTLSNPYALWVDAGATRLDGTLTASGGGALTGTWTDMGTVTTIDINGGTLDGTVIGGSSAAAATVTTLTASGNITNTATTNIGWSVVAGANTACNTTCTNACVVGFDTGLGGSDLVDCADTTADRCLCAGAN